jgi:hypothetical protein
MGSASFSLWKLAWLYPELPLTTYFKQKRAQKSTFLLPTTDYGGTPLVVPGHASAVRFDQKILCFRNGILLAK